MAGKESYIGTVDMFAGDKAPDNWALCNGQSLSVADYYPLYMVIGTQFGGDGITNFNLPDLQGRVPICPGKGKDLTERYVGQKGGSENVKLTIDQIPSHNHSLRCDISPGRNPQKKPENNYPAYPSDGEENKLYSNESGKNMAQGMVSSEGSNEYHNNMQKYVVLNYIICLKGEYPPHWQNNKN